MAQLVDFYKSPSSDLNGAGRRPLATSSLAWRFAASKARYSRKELARSTCSKSTRLVPTFNTSGEGEQMCLLPIIPQKLNMPFLTR